MALNGSHAYTVVDVFTTEPLAGNPLAVFPDASEFDAVTMQRIARELNLAETAFVLPATRKDCAARVRIFTPAKELAFAGHPTVGAAFVLLQKGIVPSDSTDFMLEEEVGPWDGDVVESEFQEQLFHGGECGLNHGASSRAVADGDVRGGRPVVRRLPDSTAA